jgi:hypothetical protein
MRHKMKKTKKATTGAKKTRRRRRVGASGKFEPVLMNGIAVGTGIVAVRELSILGGQLFPSLMGTPVITGVIEGAIGGVVAYMAKNGFVRFAGLGAIGNGIMTILQGAGVIGAPPQTMAFNFQNRRQMGDPRLKFVAGQTTRIGSGMGSTSNNFGFVAGPARKRRFSS